MECHGASQHLVCSCNLPATCLTPQCGLLCPNDCAFFCPVLSSIVPFCCTYLSHIALPHMAGSWPDLTATQLLVRVQNFQTFELHSSSNALCPLSYTVASSPHCELEKMPYSNRILNRWGGVQVSVGVTFVNDTSQRTVRCSKYPRIHRQGNGRLRTSKIWAEAVVQLS